jgi:hypothetical protein
VTYGGDSGNRIFVLYWRCSLIRVPVIRGSTVLENSSAHTETAKTTVPVTVSIQELSFSEMRMI